MLNILFRSAVMYAVVIVAVRLMGKRQIGELQPAELVITMLISELASSPIQNANVSLIVGITPIFGLVVLEILISLLTLKFVRIRSVLYGNPLILIYRGHFRQEAMSKARVTIDDIMEIMRNNGIADISDIDYAILETNGQLSVIEKNANENSMGLPQVIVMDGKLMKNNLKERGISAAWVKKQLTGQKISSIKDVFLMTVDDDLKTFLVKKEKSKERSK